MKRIFGLFALLAACAFAHSADVTAFIAPLSSQNEVPPVDIAAGGTAVVWVHAVRDESGTIVSGSVDFIAHYNFPAPVTFTGMHIHNGPAGTNAGVVINTGIGAGAASVNSDPSGRGVLIRQAQVKADDTAGVAALRGLFTNPAGFYVNLHTTVNAGGVIRGQVRRAEQAVLLGAMSTKKENPPLEANASGLGSVVALRAYDADGTFAAGWAGFEVDYVLGQAYTLTGLHIHSGGPTVNGPVTINTGIAAGAASVATPDSGSGRLTYGVEVVAANPASLATLNGLFESPEDFYINMHTTINAGGFIRSQLKKGETIRFPAAMTTAQENPPITTVVASGLGGVTINALRDRTGNITIGRVLFDVNYRFPAAADITGLHIHDAKIGVNGGVTINSGIAGGANMVASADGFGNIMRSVNVSAGQALASLNSLVTNPENHYINLHTVVNAGGVFRAQLGEENTKTPVVRAVISAVSDVNLKNAAPGGLITIFGDNLVKVGSDLDGVDDTRMPVAVNGTSVKIGGVDAPVLWVGNDPSQPTPSFLMVQVPFEVKTGANDVVVKSSNGTAAAFSVTVAASAPAVFFDGQGTIAVRVPDLSLIRTDNAARAGDILAVFATGLGQSNPALITGQITNGVNAVASAVTATIGGTTARVMSATILPNYPGYYLVQVQVPAGLRVGGNAVVITQGGVASNSTTLPIR